MFSVEALSKTLIDAMDYGTHHLYDFHRDFYPPNYYGLQIFYHEIKLNQIPRELLPWLLDSIGFWARDGEQFKEFRADIKSRLTVVEGFASLRLTPPIAAPRTS